MGYLYNFTSTHAILTSVIFNFWPVFHSLILSKPSKAALPIQMTSSQQHLHHHQAENQLQQHLHHQPMVVMLSMISTALVKVCSVKSPMLPVMLTSHALVHHAVSNVLTHQNHQMSLESSANPLERQRNKDGRTVTRNSVLEHQSHVVPNQLLLQQSVVSVE